MTQEELLRNEYGWSTDDSVNSLRMMHPYYGWYTDPLRMAHPYSGWNTDRFRMGYGFFVKMWPNHSCSICRSGIQWLLNDHKQFYSSRGVLASAVSKQASTSAAEGVAITAICGSRPTSEWWCSCVGLVMLRLRDFLKLLTLLIASANVRLTHFRSQKAHKRTLSRAMAKT